MISEMKYAYMHSGMVSPLRVCFVHLEQTSHINVKQVKIAVTHNNDAIKCIVYWYSFPCLLSCELYALWSRIKLKMQVPIRDNCLFRNTTKLCPQQQRHRVRLENMTDGYVVWIAMSTSQAIRNFEAAPWTNQIHAVVTLYICIREAPSSPNINRGSPQSLKGNISLLPSDILLMITLI
jgi:hypothetical protein